MHSESHWRASLVPVVVVILAPIAYVIVAVVEKLVVGFRLQTRGVV